MIDIHCHLLPGVDDGPQTLEESLALARALVADGVTHAVVTPHVFPGRYANTRSSIEAAHALFANALRTYGIPLHTTFAGEVRLSPDVLDLLEQGELPCLDAASAGPDVPTRLNALLLEMPDDQVPLGSDRLVAHLRGRGYTPVIVHPERNKGVMERPDRLKAFIDAGCRIQITAASVLGEFGSRAKETARGLIDRGWVHVVANDAHHTRRRAPRMAPARLWVAQRYGETVAHQFFEAEPARLCGLPVGAGKAVRTS